MKILFEAKKLKNYYSGLGQTVFALGHAMNALAEKENIYIKYYLPKECKGIFGKKAKYITANGFYQKHPRLLGKNDIFYLSHPYSRFNLKKIKAKIVTTVLDLNFLYEELPEKHKQKIKDKLQYTVDHSDAIVCISEFTKHCLIEHIDTGDTPIEVIYCGLNMDAAIQAVKPNVKQPFLFTLGAVPKKNIEALVTMLGQLETYQLVVGGNIDEQYKKKLVELAKQSNVPDRLIFSGPITDAEKYGYYKECAAFCFPSIAEGFGLPPIESMALGKPTFVSNKTSLPEVCGAEAYYWETFDPAEMAKVLTKGLENFKQDSTKVDRMKTWIKKYSWQTAAQNYIDIFKKTN